MLRLLEQLWGNRKGYGEIRAMKAGRVEQTFVEWPLDDAHRTEFLQTLEDLKADHDIYFGVLLRETRSGKALDCEPDVHWLWADVDWKSGATYSSILAAPIPPPQIVVDSGHGWHMYWRLKKPVSHRVAQEAMTSIASQIKGDSVGDPARILRLPDTLNQKDDPPRSVRILRWKNLDHGWRLGDFDLRPGRNFVNRIFTGVTGSRGTRSEELFSYALREVRAGKADHEIYDGMLGIPAGSKLTEMPKARADRWASQTIGKARKLLS